jgi:hypothetical protein
VHGFHRTLSVVPWVPRVHHDHHVSFAPSIHSVRRVFPITAGSQFILSHQPSVRPLGHARLPPALRVATASDLVQEFGSPLGQSSYSLHCLFRGLTHRSFAQLWVIMSQGFNRYYDLIRRSLELSAASSLFPLNLCVAAVRVTFPSLPCQTCSGCHHPYPARENVPGPKIP